MIDFNDISRKIFLKFMLQTIQYDLSKCQFFHFLNESSFVNFIKEQKVLNFTKKLVIFSFYIHYA